MWQFWKSCNLILHPPWVCFDVCYYLVTILSQEILSLSHLLSLSFSLSLSETPENPEPQTCQTNAPYPQPLNPISLPCTSIEVCTGSQLGGMLMTGIHRSPVLGCWRCISIGACHWQQLGTGWSALAFTSSLLGIYIKMQSLFKKPQGDLKQTSKALLHSTSILQV